MIIKMVAALALADFAVAHLEYYVLPDVMIDWAGCRDACEEAGWTIACIEDESHNEAAQEAIDNYGHTVGDMEGLPDEEGKPEVGRRGTWIGYSTPDQGNWTAPYDKTEDYGTFVWEGDCEPVDEFENWAQFTSLSDETVEPNNYNGPDQIIVEPGYEACTEMSPEYDGTDFTPYWNDNPCTAENYCMCSRPYQALSMSYSMSYSM